MLFCFTLSAGLTGLERGIFQTEVTSELERLKVLNIYRQIIHRRQMIRRLRIQISQRTI